MATAKSNTGQKGRMDLPGYRIIIFSGMIITICMLLFALLLPNVLGHLNGKMYDEYLTRAPLVPASDRILIVDVDENSLREHGQWPWPRYKIAAILDRLNQAGAAAIGLDMMFPEKDRTSLSIIKEDLRHDLNLSVEFHSGAVYPDNDRLLADAISKSPAVLGFQFLFDAPAAPSDCRLHPLNLAKARDVVEPGNFPVSATHVTCNLRLLTEKASHSGFFNIAPDADGILRNVPLIMAYENHFYPSLALASVLQALKPERIGLIRQFDDYLLVFGQTRVPLNSRGCLLVKYRGKGKTYRYVSAADLLAGRVAMDYIKDKIVFVGTSAAGLKELRSTSTDPIFPGVEVHATVADNLLTGDFISRPASAPGFEFMAAFVCGILCVFATGKAGALRSLAMVSIGSAGLVLISFWFFNTKGIYFSPILPLFVLIANFALLNLLKFWREELKGIQQTRDLALAQAAIIESMAALTETRDPKIGGHIKRTQEYIRLLALALRKHSAYRANLNDEIIDLLYKSAPLHDIGKVGVSDRILLKPSELSANEIEEMRRHATIGKNVIAAIDHRLGNHSFLRIAHEITYTHHEKWDGSGYPQGLKGEQIPLSGRLMAIVDMYDALTSKRVYKEALSHEEAVRIMTDQAQASFDPQIFESFLKICDDFQEVALKIVDPEKYNYILKIL